MVLPEKSKRLEKTVVGLYLFRFWCYERTEKIKQLINKQKGKERTFLSIASQIPSLCFPTAKLSISPLISLQPEQLLDFCSSFQIEGFNLWLWSKHRASVIDRKQPVRPNPASGISARWATVFLWKLPRSVWKYTCIFTRFGAFSTFRLHFEICWRHET